MISYIECKLNHLSIHHSGNILSDEKYRLSAKPFSVNDETLHKLLLDYFLSPFEKVNEVYRFHHPSNDLQLKCIISQKWSLTIPASFMSIQNK